jgi:hypothetical protein
MKLFQNLISAHPKIPFPLPLERGRGQVRGVREREFPDGH